MAKRLAGPERRASIIAAAKSLFADKGFYGVSVDEIVREVGVSPAVLYRHFESKDALYEAVLDELACKREDYVETIVNGDTDFASVLLGITRVYALGVLREPDSLRLELHSRLQGHEATAKFFEYRWKTFSDFIEFSVNEAQQVGELKNVDGRIAGLMFQGMFREILMSKCLQSDSRFSDVALLDLVDDVVAFFLETMGIAAREV